MQCSSITPGTPNSPENSRRRVQLLHVKRKKEPQLQQDTGARQKKPRWFKAGTPPSVIPQHGHIYPKPQDPETPVPHQTQLPLSHCPFLPIPSTGGSSSEHSISFLCMAVAVTPSLTPLWFLVSLTEALISNPHAALALCEGHLAGDDVFSAGPLHRDHTLPLATP